MTYQIMQRFILIIVFVLTTVGIHGQGNCSTHLDELRSYTWELELDKLMAGVARLEKCLHEEAVSDTTLLVGYHYFKGDVFRKKSKLDSFRYHLKLAQAYAEASRSDISWLNQYLHHRLGLLAYKSGELEEAGKYFDEVSARFQGGDKKDFPFHLDQVIAYSNYYEKLDSFDQALAVFEEGVAACKAQGTPFAEDRLGVLCSNIASVFKRKGEMLVALEYSRLGTELFFRQHDDTDPQAMMVYNNLGGDYLGVNNYPKAVFFLEKAYQCFLQDHGPNETPGDVILNNLGSAYHKTGDTEKAIKAFEQVIAIRTKAYGKEHVRTALAQFHASSMYVELGRPETSVQLLKQSRAALANYAGVTHPYVGLCDQNLAVAYRANEQYAEALASYQSALAILRANRPLGHSSFSPVMRNLSNLFLVQENYPEALHWIEKALALDEANFGERAPKTAYTTGIYATTLFKNGQEEEALLQYKKAFDRFGLADASDQDFTKLADPKSALGTIGFFLDDLWSANKKESQPTLLQKIARRAEQGIALLEWQRTKFSGDQIKTLWIHNNYRLYEYLIVARLKLYEQTKDDSLLANAAAYAERAKGSILLDALLQSGASQFAGVPPEVIHRGGELKSALSFLELKLRAATEAEAPDWQQQVFAKQQEIEAYQKQIADTYPKYHDLISHKKAGQLASSVTSLPGSTAMISYFLGTDFLVAFVHLGGQIDYVLLPLQANFFSELELLISVLATPPATNQPFGASAYGTLASKMYQQLLQPIRARLVPEVKHLIILPDGVLHYLPFSALLTAAPQEGVPLNEQAFLLHDFSISYAPSQAVWRNMQALKVPAQGILAIAPVFGDNKSLTESSPAAQREGLGDLIFNEQEASMAATFGRSIPLLGEEASLENFRAAIGKVDILHLATHAKVEATDYQYSYLAFSGATTEADTGRLYLSAVYGMELPMNMVVLSACETGLGKLRRGEGLMSLARGFTYAGAKSIVPSLWSVNDLSTASIMEAFYAALAAGETKPEALRKAKINYLSKAVNATEAHPYYWAAFTVIGDGEPIKFAAKRFPWWWLGGLGLSFLLLLYWAKRRQGD